MRVLAPAKLNLHLRVAPPDGSGFHPLMSWMCTIGLFDTLTIEPADTTGVSLTCDDPSLPCDQTNLVMRAALAMQGEALRDHPGTRIGATMHLQKRIPSGAGLGGGSSDAARTLLALNRMWKLNWPVSRLARIAETLGSDVPFFLHGSSSICTGRGELVQRIAPPRPRWAVVVLPDYALPTPAVYRKFDELRIGSAEAVGSRPPFEQWTELTGSVLLERLVNDLEPAAFAICPQLRQLREQAGQCAGRPVRMTGSGSTLFTLFDETSEAKSAAAHIEECVKTRTAIAEVAPALVDDLTVV
jgi:4-diphosphocytidyl-2-C-methyl-D-erythritol kinase